MNIDPTIWVALISAIIGTLGTKIIDASIQKRQIDKDKEIHMVTFRNDKLHELEEDLDETEEEVDEWKEKYYNLKEQNLILKAYIAQLDPDLLLEEKKDQP
jgi:peptidoglycan hydrolase CwlO-like protein